MPLLLYGRPMVKGFFEKRTCDADRDVVDLGDEQ
jgi:hypothetical protein